MSHTEASAALARALARVVLTPPPQVSTPGCSRTRRHPPRLVSSTARRRHRADASAVGAAIAATRIRASRSPRLVDMYALSHRIQAASAARRETLAWIHRPGFGYDGVWDGQMASELGECGY